jgi:hypothetical protein
MANYTKATNFLAKDSLATGDPAKIIKGSEFDTEFNAIQTAVNSKANTISPAFTSTPTAPTAAAGTNTTQLATTEFVTTGINALGTMAVQNASSIAITGGTITGITDLTVADGGTGASSITANSVILGNGTSALSSNLVAPSTSGNILTSNGTTWTSAAPSGVGMGQTWQNLTASRAYDTTYTNSTGKPIAVSVSGQSTSNGSFVHIVSVNGNEISYQTTYAANAGYIHNIFFIVPNSATYSVTGTGGTNTTSLSIWSELR